MNQNDEPTVELEAQTEEQTIEELKTQWLNEVLGSEDAHERLSKIPEYNKALQRATSKASRKAQEEAQVKIEASAKQKLEDQVFSSFFETQKKGNPEYYRWMEGHPEWSQKIREINLRSQGIDPHSYTRKEAAVEIGENVKSFMQGDERYESIDWEDVEDTPIHELPFVLAEQIAAKRMAQMERRLKETLTEEFQAKLGEELAELHLAAPQPSVPPGPALVAVEAMSDQEVLRAFGQGSQDPNIIKKALKLRGR